MGGRLLSSVRVLECTPVGRAAVLQARSSAPLTRAPLSPLSPRAAQEAVQARHHAEFLARHISRFEEIVRDLEAPPVAVKAA